MKFPTYWSQATFADTDVDGHTVETTCWRWSDASVEEAHQSALETARRVVRRLISGESLGRYEYGRAPLREEVIQSITDENGELTAAVTQNAYGSLVLNTARVMFIDVDFPPVSPAHNCAAFLAACWARRPRIRKPTRNRRSSNSARPIEVSACDCIAPAQDYGPWSHTRCLIRPKRRPANCWRQPAAIPCTFGCAEPSGRFEPRLTPKPWRCGHTANQIPWPRNEEAQRSRFEKWQAEYLARQSGFATCRYLGSIGVDQLRPEVAPILELHDRLSHCADALELA